MDKRVKKERAVTSSDSPPEGGLAHELQDLPFTSKREEERHSKKETGRSTTGKAERKSKHLERTDSDSNLRKKSRIQELLSTFKDDVVHMRDGDIVNDEVSTDRFPIPAGGSYPADFPGKFTRVSPQKLSSTSSKWKRAVRLSRNVMSRPKQTLSNASRGLKGEGDEEMEEESTQIKMISLLQFFDHASSICSGLLAGLLLWSTLNSVSWLNELTRTIYTEKFLRLYYTTTVILMYITLIGFLIRIYTTWTRLNGLFIVYVFAFISVLFLHYITKGFNFLSLECAFYNGLSETRKKKAIKAYSCSNHEPEIMQQELIFIIVSNGLQTLGALVIASYFHFIPYKQLWVAPASKISSRRIMSP